MTIRTSLMLAGVFLLSACAGNGPQKSPADKMTIRPAAAEPRKITLPEFETVQLANGMTVLLAEKHDVPMVAFRAVIRGGALADAPGKEGTGALLAELMQKGAGNRDAAAFAEAVESVGGNFSVSSGLEMLGVSGDFMSRDRLLMLDLLRDVLLEPALDKNEFDKVRARSIQQIASMKDTNLRYLTGVYGHAFLFGKHPYGRPEFGSEATLANIGYADLRRYYIEQVGADRTTLVITGDFDTAEMKQAVEKRFGGWRKAAKPAPDVQPVEPVQGRRVLLVDKPGATQTYFFIGNTGVAMDYDKRAVLDLVHTVYGGRFTSMLNTALRVESGLSYGAGDRLVKMAESGSVAISSFTRSESTVEAIDLALDVLNRLHEQGVSPEMLDSAKAYVLGQFPPRLETNPGIAAQLADIAFYGLGRAYIDDYAENIAAVDTADAAAVIDAVYPSTQNLVFVLIGDADSIREQAAKYGPVTEMKITDKRFRP